MYQAVLLLVIRGLVLFCWNNHKPPGKWLCLGGSIILSRNPAYCPPLHQPTINKWAHLSCLLLFFLLSLLISCVYLQVPYVSAHQNVSLKCHGVFRNLKSKWLMLNQTHKSDLLCGWTPVKSKRLQLQTCCFFRVCLSSFVVLDTSTPVITIIMTIIIMTATRSSIIKVGGGEKLNNVDIAKKSFSSTGNKKFDH